MKCFYHNDADGKCAGFWVHYRTRLAPHTETMDFIEMSYEKPFPMDRFAEVSAKRQYDRSGGKRT